MGFLRRSSGGGELLGSGSVVGRDCPRHSVAATIKFIFLRTASWAPSRAAAPRTDASMIEKAVSDEREGERESMA